jgi:hypothetical protein
MSSPLVTETAIGISCSVVSRLEAVTMMTLLSAFSASCAASCAKAAAGMASEPSAAPESRIVFRRVSVMIIGCSPLKWLTKRPRPRARMALGCPYD